jgi:hypothetical protein
MLKFYCKYCPIINAFIQFIFLIVGLNFLISLTTVSSLKSNEQSYLKTINNYVNYCGSDYYFSLIKVDKLNKKFNYENVYGCNEEKFLKKENCFFSVKDRGLNSIYGKEYDIESSLIDFFSNIDNFEMAFFDDLKRLSSKFKNIDDILNNTNLEIKNVSFSKYENKSNIFLSTITNTDKLIKCNRKHINLMNRTLLKLYTQ